MKVLLAHPGTQHAPRLATELASRDLLGEFWTGLAICENGFVASAFRSVGLGSILNSLGMRLIRRVESTRVRTMPWLEFSTLRKLKSSKDCRSVIHSRNLKFQRRIPSSAIAAVDTIIAFDASAWLLFEEGKRVGKRLLLDRTTTHPEEWLNAQYQLFERYPGWSTPIIDRPEYLRKAEEAEHDLADLIVVGGSFASDTLKQHGVAGDKIFVNPYGVEFAEFSKDIDFESEQKTRTLRFLFLGKVCLRKGVPLLLDAWKKLNLTRKSAELWIAGPYDSKVEKLVPADISLKLLGKVPRNEIPNLFSQCDVLVLPSYSEGFGLVLLEAVAAGLPVIASRNTGGREVVQSDALGKLFDAGDVDQLVEAMRFYLDCPPCKELVRSASESLKEYFSWSAYGDRWAGLLEEDQC